jgi:Tfp pilus assembly protein PilV
MKKNISHNNKGFTIIETLVAITILMLALTGPLVIIAQALKASFFSRDQITAFYLAQESVEYIRNLRDETSLSSDITSDQWLSGILGDDCLTTNTCVNDFSQSVPQYKFNLVYTGQGYQLVPCDTTGCAPLNYQRGVSNDVPYGGSGAEVSPFTRTIWITNTPGADNALVENPANPSELSMYIPMREVMVHVEVTWKQGTADNKFILESHLLNWKLEK